MWRRFAVNEYTMNSVWVEAKALCEELAVRTGRLERERECDINSVQTHKERITGQNQLDGNVGIALKHNRETDERKDEQRTVGRMMGERINEYINAAANKYKMQTFGWWRSRRRNGKWRETTNLVWRICFVRRRCILKACDIHGESVHIDVRARIVEMSQLNGLHICTTYYIFLYTVWIFFGMNSCASRRFSSISILFPSTHTHSRSFYLSIACVAPV